MDVNAFLFAPPAVNASDINKITEYLIWVPVYCSGEFHLIRCSEKRYTEGTVNN